MERLDLTEQELQRLRDVSVHGILGIQNHGRRKDSACPFCGGGKRTACFSLYPDNSFHCYSCSAHGQNAIDFMKLLYPSKNFVDIVLELVKFL